MSLHKASESEFVMVSEHELLADNGSVLRSTAVEIVDKEEDGNEVKTSSVVQEMDGKSIKTKNGVEETSLTEEEKENFKNLWLDLWRPILK
jgi:hypothetical protein